MKIYLSILACLSVLSAPLPLLAEEKHGHTISESASLQLNSGKKWETDPPLRTGMAAIRDTLAAKLGDIHDGKLTKSQYTELSERISAHTDSIFKNCKLSPKADAQLHLILVRVLDGNRQMKSAETSKGQQLGASKIIEALQLYPKYFDHPGWRPLKH